MFEKITLRKQKQDPFFHKLTSVTYKTQLADKSRIHGDEKISNHKGSYLKN